MARVHVELTGVIEMALPKEEAFPLFQPEGERRWVAGWEPRYLHPVEPDAREGIVFQTTTGEGTATWIQTRHDPTGGVASYVYVVPGHRATMVDVGVDPAGEDRSRAQVTYRMTSLSSDADAFVREFGDGFGEFMAQWEQAIQRHVVEGAPLVWYEARRRGIRIFTS